MKSRFNIIVTVLVCVAGMILPSSVHAQDNAPKDKTKKVAIFVKNRAKNVPDDKVSVLEDFVAGRITDLGFSILSREEILNSVKDFAKAGPNAAAEDNDPSSKLDAALSRDSSALALAQNMNAAYIIYPSITTFGFERAKYRSEKISTDFIEYKMRVTVKICNANDGGTMTSDVVEPTKRMLQTEQTTTEADVVNDLLSEASVMIAENLQKKLDTNKIKEVAVNADVVPFTVVCGMTDLSIPEIVKDEKGEYVVTANKYDIKAMAVTVAVDGIVVGTTETGSLQARPGIHKLRLTREGFKPVAETINIRKDGIYNFSMKMDEAGYARWKENAAFLNELKAGAKLSDAQVKMMEGLAKMAEQSGIRIDSKSDTKVNTTQPGALQNIFR